MNVRSSYIAITVVAVLAGFLVLVTYKGGSSRRTESDQDFIEEIHALQEGVSPLEGPGRLPPSGADQSLVPVIEIDPPNLEWGPVSNTSKSTAQIKVHNRGKSPLHISDIQTTCACTVGEMEGGDIPPGGTGILSVVYDPFRVFGFESTKTLTVYCNDAKRPAVQIHVKTTIEPEFSLEPMALDFGVVEKGVPAQKTMVLRQLGEEPIELTKIEPVGDSQVVSFAFSKRPETEWQQPDRPEYLIQADLADDLIPGEHSQFFKLHLVCRRFPFLSCQARVDVDAFYRVTPKRLVIAERIAKEYATATVTGDRPFELADVRTLGPGLDVRAAPTSEPYSFLIEPKPTPGAEPGDQNNAILFTVKAGDLALANRIPVHCTVGKAVRGGE